MRIAILGDALDVQFAGIHIYLRELLGALLKIDRENEYYLARPFPGGEFERVKEIVVPISPWLPGHQRIRAFTSIPRRLVEAGVDVAIEPTHFGPFALPKRVKRIAIIHDLTPIIFPQFHPRTSSLAQRLLLPHILKKADCILADSANTKRDIQSLYPFASKKTQAVLPGREEIFKPTKDPDVLKRYGVRQPYLLSVGTIEPRKNLLAMLRAYELFRRRTGRGYQWVLAGKRGWKNEDFFRALDASPFRDDIILTGYTERQDLPALYSMARLFVFPSWYEGFGLPVLEAMSCGAPVLSSPTSSLPEVGGDAAHYFDPNSSGDLAEKLEKLVSDENELLKMSELSLEQASKFSWERAARQLLNIFQTLSDGSEL